MVCGHFDLKLSRVKEGLISQQATQVEPGYRGKLFCYLFNQSGDEIDISYKDLNNSKVATIEFQYVSCESYQDEEYRKQIIAEIDKEHCRKYSDPLLCNGHGINDVRFFDGSLPKHAGLSSIAKRLDAAQEEARKGCASAINGAAWVKVGFFTLLAIITSLILGYVNRGTVDKFVDALSLMNGRDGKFESARFESDASRRAIEDLHKESQEAYEMAVAALEELSIKKKILTSKNEGVAAVKIDKLTENSGNGGMASTKK
jgi:hypothetical protein